MLNLRYSVVTVGIDISMESLQGGHRGAMQMCTCAVQSLSRMGETSERKASESAEDAFQWFSLNVRSSLFAVVG